MDAPNNLTNVLYSSLRATNTYRLKLLSGWIASNDPRFNSANTCAHRQAAAPPSKIPSPSTPRISAKKKPTRVAPSWLNDLWSIRLDRFFIESLVCPRCNSQKTTSNKTREFKGVTTKPLSKRLSNALTHDNYAQKHPYRCAYPSRPQTKPER